MWWRAQIVQRLSGQDPRIERATRPLAWGLGFGAVTTLVAVTVAVMLAFGQVRAALSGTSLEPAMVWASFAVLVAGVPIVALVVLFMWILREA